MPVDPQMQAILDARAGLPPLHTLTVEQARARLKAPRPPGLRVEEVAAVADRTIPGPGGPLGLRVYRPRAPAPSRCWCSSTAAAA